MIQCWFMYCTICIPHVNQCFRPGTKMKSENDFFFFLYVLSFAGLKAPSYINTLIQVHLLWQLNAAAMTHASQLREQSPSWSLSRSSESWPAMLESCFFMLPTAKPCMERQFKFKSKQKQVYRNTMKYKYIIQPVKFDHCGKKRWF